MHRLLPHPDFPPSATLTIKAALRSLGGGDLVTFRYEVTGAVGALILPRGPGRPPRRADELWKTTCFEAFADLDGSAYREFNFSPSGDWAAYDFAAYREDLQNAVMMREPMVAIIPSDEMLAIDGIVADSDLSGATSLGLSAVIEEKDGTKSYWALAHPPGKPDFHHPDCFVLELPAAGQ